MSSDSPPRTLFKPGRFSSKPGFLLPAVQALVIQLVSFILLYLLLHTARSMFDWQVTIVVAALLQGVIAAALSRWRHLPSWWLLIQFVFPIAMLAAYSLELHPGFFFGALLLLILIYWTPFKTRVPLYLSGASVWDMVSDLLPKDEPINFIDIGSGLGGLVLDLAKRHPNAGFTGIELAPFPWFVSWARARVTHSRACFILSNYNKADFSQFDIIFAYLSPAAMEALWEKANLEMRAGGLLLSFEFLIPDIKPDIVVNNKITGALLYGWRISNISNK